MEEQNALGKSVSLEHFGGLKGYKYMSLSTFKKDGTAVATPVWFVDVGGRLQLTTTAETGKVKRIRNNPSVTVAPCDLRGRVLGSAVEGRARVVEKEEGSDAHSNLASKYGLIYRGFIFVEGIVARKATQVFVEITAPNDPTVENGESESGAAS